MHGLEKPSSWLLRWQHLFKPGARVLDLACGAGRHVRFLVAAGYSVVGVDVNEATLKSCRDSLGQLPASAQAQLVQADLESGPWPFDGETFDAIVVTNYLWRPLMPHLLRSLNVGGVLVYETFAAGNETVGKPSRSDFLLRKGELLQLCQNAQPALHVLAYEDGFLAEPSRFVQRVVAINEAEQKHQSGLPARYAL